jgi:hypothetical protein
LTGEAVGVKRRYLVRPVQPSTSAFAGFRFPPEVVGTLAFESQVKF